ncbi:MAG: ABC transporter permease subunit [Deltaproteobacteria bacterium]|nr:ABC transporter permease subunit [Deltaproteobacteria bacterium]
MTEAAAATGSPQTAPAAGRSPWRDAAAHLRRNRAAMAGLLTLCVLAVLSVAVPMLSPYTIDEIFWDAIGTGPSLAGGHLFGTDANGRDLLLRTLYAGRISLSVGLAASVVSVLVGVFWGTVSGYAGGTTDSVMMRFVDILYALPFMFFVILLMVYFGRHVVLIFVAIGMVEWLDMARIVRGETLSLKRREFVEAARAMGAAPAWIVLRHVIPNVVGPVAVFATLTVPRAILFESFLSFLGLGIQEPMTSWGVLISEGATQMETHPWALVLPATFLAATLFSLNFLGDGLRDALDPKQR